MTNVYTSADQLIGNTPILRLTHVEESLALSARIYAKLEFLNPAGSVKDRVAREMLDEAERTGRIRKGATVIEPTSGNTGIGLASVAAARGYRSIIVMPDTMSRERIALARAYGAEVVLSEGVLGMKGAIAVAEQIARETENSFIPGQFDNPANPEAHRKTTGPEIFRDMDGDVDVFVAGVGTGGTLTGVGEYLKSHKASVSIVAVEPDRSPMLSEGIAGPHGLQGIGANFVPSVLNTEIYDEVLRVTDEDAYAAVRMLGRREGILVGISSGAALHAAITLARRPENKGKSIVVLLPDSGERYLSTGLFE